MQTPCVKLSRDGVILEVKKFTFASDRETWLLINGFLSFNGVYAHMDGRVAGKFYGENPVESTANQRYTDIQEFRICDKPIVNRHSMWCRLLGINK